MGQKVDPRGLRLGISKNWESNWYAEKQDYVKKLNSDIKIREFLSKKLKDAFALYHAHQFKNTCCKADHPPDIVIIHKEVEQKHSH